ncbi:MAG: tetratricopeptide repeat protein [Lachnospiraceae bacterium]|nr:tetratricopeptide repeat protein [Lachnospiraceae bacterium]
MHNKRLKQLKKRIAAAGLIVGLSLFAACSSKEGNKTKEGIQSIQAGDFEGAFTLFEEAEAEKENPVYLNRGIGLAYMGQNQYDLALESFEKALAADGSVPGDVDYDINYYIGVCFYKLGRYEDAKARFDAILALREKDVDAYVERGTVLLALDQKDEAIADFNKAVELSPKDYGLFIDIYCILSEAGERTTGASYLQNAVDSGDKKMPDYDKGRLYFYLEDYSNARDFLEKAKGSGNGSEELILLLGQCYENLNDRNYAITVYQSYLATGQSKAVYNQMGMCYAATGDYENALAAFQNGIGLSDLAFDQELRFNEIVAYEKLGNPVKAKELMTSYIQDYPNDEVAQREYQFLKTR